MQESRLNSFQQRQLNTRLKSGQALPTTCHPTTSAKPRKPAQKAPLPKVLNPRNYSGGLKSREVIEASGAYEKTDYKPRPVGKLHLLLGKFLFGSRLCRPMLFFDSDFKLLWA